MVFPDIVGGRARARGLKKWLKAFASVGSHICIRSKLLEQLYTREPRNLTIVRRNELLKHIQTQCLGGWGKYSSGFRHAAPSLTHTENLHLRRISSRCAIHLMDPTRYRRDDQGMRQKDNDRAGAQFAKARLRTLQRLLADCVSGTFQRS